MENLDISVKRISWEISKERFGSRILYKNHILKFSDHISICKEMYVNGEPKTLYLVHVPLELLENIHRLEICD